MIELSLFERRPGSWACRTIYYGAIGIIALAATYAACFALSGGEASHLSVSALLGEQPDANACWLMGRNLGNAGGSLQPQPPDDSWPLARGNALNDGVAQSTLPEKLEIVWEYSVPNGAFQAAAVIVDDGQQQLAVIADADGRVYALRLSDGELVWKFAGELGFVTSPSFREGRYYVGDVTGVFYCLDRDGKELWRFATEGQIDSSATFYKDCVLFGSQDSNLYCLRCDTGELVWQVTTGDQIRCAPTIVENRAFAAGCDGYLHIIDVDKGEEIGKVDIRSPTGATPAARGDLIYFGTEQAGFLAVNWRSSQQAWEYMDRESTSVRGNAAVVAGHVLFSTPNRQALSLNPENGQLNWATTLRSGSESSPVVVGERVFLSTTGGRLYALQLKSGDILQEWELRGRMTASPAVGFQRLVIATERGVVSCLGSAQGRGGLEVGGGKP